MELLAEEREIVHDLGRIYTRMTAIVGDAVTREDDLREIRAHIHDLQHAVMAQAAARCYPREFRLLGELVCAEPSEPLAPHPVTGDIFPSARTYDYPVGGPDCSGCAP